MADTICIDMKEQFVYDPLISKRQQYLLATQLVRAVLKIGGCSVSLSDLKHLLNRCHRRRDCFRTIRRVDGIEKSQCNAKQSYRTFIHTKTREGNILILIQG